MGCCKIKTHMDIMYYSERLPRERESCLNLQIYFANGHKPYLKGEGKEQVEHMHLPILST